MEQAHPHAAICTRRGAGHITQGLCEIASVCPGACLPMRACYNTAQASPALGAAEFRAWKRVGSHNNAWWQPAWHNHLSVWVGEIMPWHRPSRQSVVVTQLLWAAPPPFWLFLFFFLTHVGCSRTHNSHPISPWNSGWHHAKINLHDYSNSK